MRSTLVILLALLATTLAAGESEIRLETTVKASREAVWDAWTTTEGVRDL